MSSAEAPTWWDDVEEPAAPRRETAAGTGSSAKVECLSRAHAADFADAFDLDGAFGAPTRRFTRESEQVIVLERRPATDVAQEPYEPVADEPAPILEATYEEESVAADPYLGEAPQIDPETGRRTVRVTGRPEAAVAPRRLREIESRRPRRGAVERAASRPDRIALYAVLLGLFLVVLAAASSSAHP